MFSESTKEKLDQTISALCDFLLDNLRNHRILSNQDIDSLTRLVQAASSHTPTTNTFLSPVIQVTSELDIDKVVRQIEQTLEKEIGATAHVAY